MSKPAKRGDNKPTVVAPTRKRVLIYHARITKKGAYGLRKRWGWKKEGEQ